jgi:hypothetical protein
MQQVPKFSNQYEFLEIGRIDQGFRLRGTNRPEGFDAVSSS